MSALELIHRERERQRAKGYDAEHDDGETAKELAGGAMTYLMAHIEEADPRSSCHDLWPWHDTSPKFEGGVRDLVKAGALIVAEIERLQRLAEAPCP